MDVVILSFLHLLQSGVTTTHLFQGYDITQKDPEPWNGIHKGMNFRSSSFSEVGLRCSQSFFEEPRTSWSTVWSFFFRFIPVCLLSSKSSSIVSDIVVGTPPDSSTHLNALLLIDKTRVKDKTYIWLSVWYKDEVKRREVWECEGWVWDLDTIGDPSVLRLIQLLKLQKRGQFPDESVRIKFG